MSEHWSKTSSWPFIKSKLGLGYGLSLKNYGHMLVADLLYRVRSTRLVADPLLINVFPLLSERMGEQADVHLVLPSIPLHI